MQKYVQIFLKTQKQYAQFVFSRQYINTEHVSLLKLLSQYSTIYLNVLLILCCPTPYELTEKEESLQQLHLFTFQTQYSLNTKYGRLLFLAERSKKQNFSFNNDSNGTCVATAEFKPHFYKVKIKSRSKGEIPDRQELCIINTNALRGL